MFIEAKDRLINLFLLQGLSVVTGDEDKYYVRFKFTNRRNLR